MATHSSILAWRIPWTEEPGGLQSMGSQRVGHEWSNLAHTHARILHWVCWRSFLGPLDCKEIKPVNPKGNQSWIFLGRTGAEAEAPILWPPDAKSWLIRKDPNIGKDWRQEEKGITEDEMVGWHHRLNRNEFEQAPGDNEGQGSLVCCSPWGCKELDTTQWLNNSIKSYYKIKAVIFTIIHDILVSYLFYT